MGKTNWDKVGYHTDFTLTTLKSLYSLRVYLEQKCRDLLSCVKTSQQGQARVESGTGEPQGGKGRDFPLHSVTSGVPLTSSTNERVTCSAPANV